MIANSVEKSYEYKLKRGPITWLAIFLGAFAILMGYFATTNDRSLRLRSYGSSTTLSTNQASVFLWILTAVVAAVVVLCIVLLVASYRVDQRIAFTEAGLLIPRSFYSSREKLIAYDDVRNLLIRSNNHQRWLEIEHLNGKSLIYAVKLPSHQAFDELVNFLAVRVRGDRNV